MAKSYAQCSDSAQTGPGVRVRSVSAKADFVTTPYKAKYGAAGESKGTPKNDNVRAKRG